MSAFYARSVVLLLAWIWLKPEWWMQDFYRATAGGEAVVREQIFLGGLLLAGLPVIMWVETIFWVGCRCLRAVPVMADIFLRCRRGWVLLVLVAAFLWFLWLAPSASTDPSPYQLEMSVMTIATVALLWLQPPFGLILGESAGRTGRVLGSVSARLFPLRVVALLDTTRGGLSGGVGAFGAMTDSLRTVNADDWRAVVDAIERVVSIIVLDTRTNSTLVIDEVGEILRNPDRLARTLFVIGSEGQAPALEAHHRTGASPGLWVATETEVEATLRSSGGAIWP